MNPQIDAGPAATPGTRERIVLATSRLLARQGYEATGMKLISREANATLGSIYHFFPGGKQELAAAAVRHCDQQYAGPLREALDSQDDPGAAIKVCTGLLATLLRDAGWIGACPLTATALETADTPEIQQAVTESFEHWQELVFDKLHRTGLAEPDARDLACTVMNTIEGAQLAAQIFRSDRPLRLAGVHLARLINCYL